MPNPTFINLSRISERYGFKMLNCDGNIARRVDDSADQRKLAKKGVWLALTIKGELRAGRGILMDGSNPGLDQLASDIANGRVELKDLL